MRIRRNLSIAVITGVVLASCGGSSSGTEPQNAPTNDNAAIVVAASFYPIAEIVQRVGGSAVEVFNLTPAGTDAHELELTAKQLESLQDAKMTFYIGANYQASVEKALSTIKGSVVDVLKAVKVSRINGEDNPHVWLDPANMVLITRLIAESLSTSRPALAEQFSKNASTYISELELLGSEIDAQLANCESTVLVTAHYAFSYLTERAQLTNMSISGLDHHTELSAQELEDMAAILRKAKVTTVFNEEMVPSDLVNALAKTLGARASSLNPIEGLTNAEIAAGATYVSVQRDNLDRIAQGLRCA